MKKAHTSSEFLLIAVAVLSFLLSFAVHADLFHRLLQYLFTACMLFNMISKIWRFRKIASSTTVLFLMASVFLFLFSMLLYEWDRSIWELGPAALGMLVFTVTFADLYKRYEIGRKA